jgi:hypothetical protein
LEVNIRKQEIENLPKTWSFCPIASLTRKRAELTFLGLGLVGVKFNPTTNNELSEGIVRLRAQVEAEARATIANKKSKANLLEISIVTSCDHMGCVCF